MKHDGGAVPVAVTERKRVGWYNQAASEAGIQPQMPETSAWAMASDLQMHARDTHLEERALHEAALWILRFTPHVMLCNSGLIAEVQGSLRLFNGLEALTMQLADGMRELGLNMRQASAPTATAAWLLARAGECGHALSINESLDAVSLSVVDTAHDHLDTLAGIGCTTLGQLRLLPRSGVARRFGKALLQTLDRAYGHEAELYDWFTPPATFDARLELFAQVDNTDALLFAARRLLLQLTGWLTARHAGITGVTLLLFHEPARRHGHRITPVTIALAHPSRELDHLTLLLREHLAHVTLEAPVIELELKADQVMQLAAPNTELFSSPASEAESMGKLVERLQSRLGRDSVQQLFPIADSRPEKSYVLRPAGDKPLRPPHVPPSAAPPRPVWLLPQPLSLPLRHDKPFYQSELTLLAGPERIESGWWDDALATRDYFIAKNERHMLLWIFRDRCAAEASGWFLHGFFG